MLYLCFDYVNSVTSNFSLLSRETEFVVLFTIFVSSKYNQVPLATDLALWARCEIWTWRYIYAC